MLKSLTPPNVAVDVLANFAARHYGLSGHWKRLDGERDQNYCVTEAGGAAWVFKLCNPHEGEAIFACQMAALEHIARVDPDLPVPRLRRTSDGRAMANLAVEGHDHCVMLLSYLPGRVVGEDKLGGSQLRQLGQLLARLGRALRGFIDGAPASRQLAWDNRLAPHLLEHVHLLPAHQQSRARHLLTAFRDDALPRLEGLRSQIIHGDVHPFNTLIAGEAITGIIDFGDLVHGALVQDVANAAADYLTPGADTGATLFDLVSGYHAVTPLEEAELDVLLPLIEIRLLMTPLVQLLRVETGVSEHGYLAAFADRSFPILDELQGPGRGALENHLRRAAALPPKPVKSPSSIADMLQRRRRVMGNRLYMFYDPPLHMVKGEGVWLTAADGRRYLDCYNNVPHVGHCHPYVTEAIVRQARRLNTNTRYVTDESIAYAERLAATLDKGLTAVVYVNSGSEANDVAWRMAKAWTAARGGLAMDFAYHGITEAIDAFSPSNAVADWKAPHIRLLPPPDDYRGPFRRGEQQLAERYAALADAPIAELREHGYGVAAAMIDSAFMTNGMLDAPLGYLQAVAEKVRAAGGLFIADEVQSGFGRMGTAMWGHQHHGVVPDFVTIGKPAGNGHPLGAVITRPEILDHFTKSAVFFSTFGGNNVSCAAGLAVLDVIRDEALLDNARHTGAHLRTLLCGLMTKHRLIGDVRGVGLAIGVELVRDHVTREPAGPEATRLLSLIRDGGVLVGGEGKFGNILKIRPPVVFRPEHAEIAVAAIDRALGRL